MKILLSLLGSSLLPFLILILMGSLIRKWQVKGAFLALLLIIGPLWFFNHGQVSPWITQYGPHQIDMGLATGVGILTYHFLTGAKWKKTLFNLSAALVGGCLAGILLALLS
ncbi:Lin0368 family putative glycerol transporter subunit [Streptococcus rifensis]